MRIKKYSEHFPKRLFNIIPKNRSIYLDVGCAAGLLGKAIKEMNQKAEVYGIEINSEFVEDARKHINCVICGDIEGVDLSSIGKKFDCIIYADVLEHLKDPWFVLKKHKDFLTQDGIIVLSIPNIQFIGIIVSLLFGNWNYRESGILDRTHLRFFTRKTIKKLLSDTGFEIQVIRPNYSDHKFVSFLLKVCSVFGLFANYFARQYLVAAVKK